jgi:hypothetical protein
VTRDEILARRALWPLGTIAYSQIDIDPATGYRKDCSGGVSMCWATPQPGQSTVTLLPDLMHEITPDELLPGDAIGLCGPGTGGNAGHIMLFLGWTQTGLMIWEQAGGPPGPTERHIKGIPAGYKPYRLEGIDMPSPEEYAAAVWAHALGAFKLDANGTAQLVDPAATAADLVKYSNCASWNASDALTVATPDRLPSPPLRGMAVTLTDDQMADLARRVAAELRGLTFIAEPPF